MDFFGKEDIAGGCSKCDQLYFSCSSTEKISSTSNSRVRITFPPSVILNAAVVGAIPTSENWKPNWEERNRTKFKQWRYKSMIYKVINTANKFEWLSRQEKDASVGFFLVLIWWCGELMGWEILNLKSNQTTLSRGKGSKKKEKKRKQELLVQRSSNWRINANLLNIKWNLTQFGNFFLIFLNENLYVQYLENNGKSVYF